MSNTDCTLEPVTRHAPSTLRAPPAKVIVSAAASPLPANRKVTTALSSPVNRMSVSTTAAPAHGPAPRAWSRGPRSAGSRTSADQSSGGVPGENTAVYASLIWRRAASASGGGRSIGGAGVAGVARGVARLRPPLEVLDLPLEVAHLAAE